LTSVGVSVRGVRRPVQARDVVHRVARQDLVSHRKPQGQAQHDAGLLGAVVALLGELLEEVVAARHPDLAQR
jgi:hypothetical protein